MKVLQEATTITYETRANAFNLNLRFRFASTDGRVGLMGIIFDSGLPMKRCSPRYQGFNSDCNYDWLCSG